MVSLKKDLLKLSDDLVCCQTCPRQCKVNRVEGEVGYCNSDAGFYIESICVHKGEEPVLSGENGICNVFISHCNLQCIYCQNYQISENSSKEGNYKTLELIIAGITKLLDGGCEAVGFVSPSHFIPQMIMIIEALHGQGRHPTIVYNSNGYDRPETIRRLDGIIDIYLPDFKYMSSDLSSLYSDAPDYAEFATKAIKEMYNQKGSKLFMNDQGRAESGLIIRHLVLPGHAEESIKVLRYIAEEISFKVHISLMSQYYPTKKMSDHPVLNRTLFEHEYKLVVEEMDQLGFINGWIQESGSTTTYRPDFNKEHPFE
jgi:putative pyruvate formate lyase activating enzyme